MSERKKNNLISFVIGFVLFAIVTNVYITVNTEPTTLNPVRMHQECP